MSTLASLYVVRAAHSDNNRTIWAALGTNTISTTPRLNAATRFTLSDALRAAHLLQERGHYPVRVEPLVAALGRQPRCRASRGAMVLR